MHLRSIFNLLFFIDHKYVVHLVPATYVSCSSTLQFSDALSINGGMKISSVILYDDI